MLGACDFSMAKNITTFKDGLYYPLLNVCGSHANLYSVSFARELLAYKTAKLTSYDSGFGHLYKSHTIAVCWPNMVICELSTTDINHNYSPLYPKRYQRYLKSCFATRLDYANYDMFLIKFLIYVHELYKLCVGVENVSLSELVNRFNHTYRVKPIYDVLKFCPYSTKDVLEMMPTD